MLVGSTKSALAEGMPVCFLNASFHEYSPYRQKDISFTNGFDGLITGCSHFFIQ